MDAPLRAYIELRGLGRKGPRYMVRMNRADGLMLLDGSTQPLLDAARVLHSRGVSGLLEIWDAERPYCRIRGDIARAARLTVAEDQSGISFRRHVDRATDGDLEDEGAEVLEDEIARPALTPQASEGIGKEVRA